MNQVTYYRHMWEQQTPYLQWLKERKSEYDSISENDEGSVLQLPFFACVQDFMTRYGEELAQHDIVVLTSGAGYAHENIKQIFSGYFAENPRVELAYADEDYLGSLQELYGLEETTEYRDYYAEARFRDTGLYRGNPWFKPEYSPDTLYSFFYFGNVFACRSDLLRRVCWLGSEDAFENLYDAVLQMVELTDGIGHLAEVLFTSKNTKTEFELKGASEKLSKIKIARMQDKLAKHNVGSMKSCAKGIKISNDKKDKEIYRIIYTIPKQKVSIIIPSKDNSKVLGRCLDTLVQKTRNVDYEIIVVDNGSCEKEQEMIKQLQEQYGFRYLYEKDEFNFSKMCNLGAAQASGDYLLFLNDDMEILEKDWLANMLGQAGVPWAGAVGAKLYYPNTSESDGLADRMGRRIQHVGITNMGIGPAHKLGGLIDEGVMYHGHNCLTYNMLAVTAACLLVKKEKFLQVGGFDEDLVVAYNDVALCMKLYEAGYYNVIRNDAVLLHHESLSRGQDVTPEKKERLEREKALLYEKHPCFQGVDPFYSRHLVQYRKDVEYHCHNLYPYDMIGEIKELQGMQELPKLHKNKIMKKLYAENLSMLNIDAVEESEGVLTVRGWYVLRGIDNAFVEKYLLLQNQETGRIFRVKASPQLRQDVPKLFEADERTQHTELAGIQVLLQKEHLPEGLYRIGLLACIEVSGNKRIKQKLCWSEAQYQLR